jgi:hypothetical protein
MTILMMIEKRRSIYFRICVMSLIDEDQLRSQHKNLKESRKCFENVNPNDIILPCLCIDNSAYVIQNHRKHRKNLLNYYLLVIRDLTLRTIWIQPFIIVIAFLLKNFDADDNAIKNLFPHSLNGFVIYYLGAIILFLAMLGFIVIILCFLLELFNHSGPNASFFPRSSTKFEVLFLCVFFGMIIAIFYIVTSLRNIIKHRNKLWAKEETNIYYC